VLWGEVLVDGHNRYEICRKHGIAFLTVQHASFQSIDDVMLWMIDNQLGRRSVTDFQRGVLALRKRDILAARVRAEMDATIDARQATGQSPEALTPAGGETTEERSSAIPSAAIKTREDIARTAGISSNTIGQIEKIRKTAAPELVEAVRVGTISINAAAAVASLSNQEQVLAVAGGKKELRQAAKMVREQKAASRPPRAESAAAAELVAHATDAASKSEAADLRVEIATLHARIASLTAENQALQAELAGLRGIPA